VAKALRLACWNADGVRGRKLELERFLGQHGVDICLLTETHLRERETSFSLQTMFITEQTGPQREADSNTGSSGYRPLRCTRPRFDPVRGNCHTCYVG
jgi:hypothetical protein